MEDGLIVKYSTNWTEALNQMLAHSMLRGILFSGDRWSCCVVQNDGEGTSLQTAEDTLGFVALPD